MVEDVKSEATRTRVYETVNFYATVEQNIRNRREVNRILHGKVKRKAQADPGSEKTASRAKSTQSAAG